MKELIVVIVNQGFEEEVMNSARNAGARGGTMFNARGTANSSDEVKFLGITLHPDKEIVFILTDKENRNNIIEAIKSSSGLTSPGAGIIFSLPVSSVMGIGNAFEQNEDTPKDGE